jgi:hypothetical protein
MKEIEDIFKTRDFKKLPKTKRIFIRIWIAFLYNTTCIL